MSWELVYGAALVVSGLLASVWLSARSTDRLLKRLGAARSRSAKAAAPHGRLARRAIRLGWRGDPRLYAPAMLASAVALGSGGWRLAGPVGALAGLIGGPLVIEAVLSRRREGRRELLEQQVAEVATAIAAGARAGLSVRRSIEEANRDAGPPIRERLEEVRRRLDTGEPLDEALRSLGAASRDAGLVVSVLLMHGRTGGDLPGMLDEVSDIVGQRVEARRLGRALTAQGRASGAVLAVLPVAFVTLLSGTSGNGLGAFYRTPLGAGLLLAGLVLEALGFLWIRRIVRAAD